MKKLGEYDTFLSPGGTPHTLGTFDTHPWWLEWNRRCDRENERIRRLLLEPIPRVFDEKPDWITDNGKKVIREV